jgi:CDP-glucose 4,6-dehydratase
MMVANMSTAFNSDSSWGGRRVLITGATGFVGKSLVHTLAEKGAEVFGFILPEELAQFSALALEKSNVHHTIGNVNDYSNVESAIIKGNIDSIFHLAAINTNFKFDKSPRLLFDTNIRGTYNVLESARISNTVRRIVISSSREASDVKLHDEKYHGVLRSNHRPYQVSKISAELISQAYHDTYELPVTIARCSNIYGGGDLNWNRLIPATMKHVLSGAPLNLRSNGQIERDYIHIEDIVQAYLLLGNLADNKGVSGEVFSFGTGSFIAVSDVIKKIGKLVGRSDLNPIIVKKSQNERIDEQYNFKRERETLGWTSNIDIEVGLRQTLDWYKSFFIR